MDKTINVSVVQGVGGISLYVNDYRCFGCKPWGGGTSLYDFKVKVSHLKDALRGSGYVLQEDKTNEN